MSKKNLYSISLISKKIRVSFRICFWTELYVLLNWYAAKRTPLFSRCPHVCAKWVSSVCYACAKVLIQVTFAIRTSFPSTLRCPSTLTHYPCEEVLAFSVPLPPQLVINHKAGETVNPRTPSSDSWARSMTSWQSASRCSSSSSQCLHSSKNAPPCLLSFRKYFAH